MSQFINSFATINNGSGAPQSSTQIAFFDFGTTNLSTQVFSDEALEVQLTNPVVLTSIGNAPNIFLADQFYLVQHQDAGGTPLQEMPKVQGFGTSAGRSGHDWSATVTYQFNDLVEDQEKYYFSIINDNIGNTPTTAENDPNWRFANFHSNFNSTISYAINDLVTKNGIFYRSRIASNLNNDPETTPAAWANMSGIGLQTVNIPASTLNLPDALDDPATAVNTQIGDFVVVTKQYLGAGTSENAQFSIEMPESWNQGALEVMYKVLPRVGVVGTGTVVFGITAVGIGDGDNLISETFGTLKRTVITGVTTLEDVYSSDGVSFTADNITDANRTIFFNVNRDITTNINDAVFLALNQTIATGTELTLTAEAADTQDIASVVTITSGEDTSTSLFTITGIAQTGEVLVESIAGPNATIVQTLGTFVSVSKIEYTPIVVGATVTAGYIGGNDVTSVIDVLSVRILYLTVSSTDNA